MELWNADCIWLEMRQKLVWNESGFEMNLKRIFKMARTCMAKLDKDMKKYSRSNYNRKSQKIASNRRNSNRKFDNQNWIQCKSIEISQD